MYCIHVQESSIDKSSRRYSTGNTGFVILSSPGCIVDFTEKHCSEIQKVYPGCTPKGSTYQVTRAEYAKLKNNATGRI